MSRLFSSWNELRRMMSVVPYIIIPALVIWIALPGTSHGSQMERAFWARDWAGLERVYQAASDDIVKWVSGDAAPTRGLSTRDLSLYVNGLWRQSRYAEGVQVLDAVSADFPGELRPYAGIMLVLGMERTDRKSEALELGNSIWEGAPPQVRYYLAYALGRLTRDLEMPDESLMWFRRMLELASDRKRRLQALTQMIDMKGVSADEAAALLIDQPSNARALEICRSLERGSSGRAEYALGYNAYINKKYQDAMSRFNLASADVTYGEAARYYLAWSAYREKIDGTAFKLWSDIALSGFDYPQRSVQRLVEMAGRSKRADIINT
ncbi:MAG: hypothetical protein LBQ56_01475, partial [Synergistaceae bacterium]|nr:hypothetical protein [Synergistaceae bacterium]